MNKILVKNYKKYFNTETLFSEKVIRFLSLIKIVNMKSPEIFKRYDIRGEYPKELDKDIAYRLGKATGTFAKKNFRKNKVVLGYDNRESTRELKNGFVSGIMDCDVNIINIGLSTSDMAAYAGKYFKSSFSVCITASHLDWNKNGFKFRYKLGNGFLNKDLNRIKNLYLEGKFVNSSKGKIKETNFSEIYKKVLKDKFKSFGKKLEGKVVVDSCGGPSSLIVPEILESLGVEVTEINPLGEKNRHPNPTKGNLEDLSNEVKNKNADLGVAYDIDADRLSIINSNGKFVSSNAMIPLFTDFFGNGVKTVVSIDSGRVVTENIKNLHLCRVGDPFVSLEMLRKNAIFAAEPSGHYNYLPLSPHASGPFFTLIACSISKKIRNKVSKLPKYHLEKENLQVNQKEKVLNKIKAWAKENFKIISEIDGVKFSINGSHVLVRSSGTEDVIRINVESETQKEAESIMEGIKNFIG